MKIWNFVQPIVGGAVVFAAAAGADDVSILYNEVAKSANQSLLWGPYRPNLYFGVRPRLHQSFMGGLMWAKVDTIQAMPSSMSSPFSSPRL
jgi:mannosyl-oligosaccharide glucosidase